jgi:phage shock protein PspC (stress-responsive transcriptional regulator)
MKKTLTVSIGAIVFHVEEDAFEKLSRYLDAIKLQFRGFTGRDELISDIEARIAEILQGKLNPGKEVITVDDIDEVISILGQPADFELDGQEPGASAGTPPSYPQKRLYRDPEGKMIGGVCTGLGAYFGLDPVWIRIIFLVLIFASGFSLVVYLILWIAVPEARSNAEKLEMKGEPVNLSNLEKSIEKEAGQVKEKLHEFSARAKQTFRAQKADFKNRHQPHIMDGLSEIGQLMLRLLIIFCGFIILTIGIALTIAYLSILFRFPVIAVMDQAGLQAFPLYELTERIFETDTDLRAFSTGLMVLAGIPLLMLLWAGIRLIFAIPRVRVVSSIAGMIWICALVITLIFGFKVANAFRGTGEFAQETPLDVRSSDTLFVTTDGRLPLGKGWERSGMFYFPEARIAVMNDEKVLYGIPLLKFKASSDSTSHITVTTNARGVSRTEAVETAEKVDYKWNLTNDTLVLSDNFTLPDDEKWRKQETRVEVHLPEGTTVMIDKNVYPIMGYHKNVAKRERIGTMYYMDNEGLVKR